MKIVNSTKKYVIGNGSGAPVWIAKRSENNTLWTAAIKLGSGSGRVYRSIGSHDRVKDAEVAAIREYNKMRNDTGAIAEGIHEILSYCELLGTWMITDDEFKAFLSNNDREGSYVYALFPSVEIPVIKSINDIFEYIEYGKIGSSGMGKDSRKSLRHRMINYYRNYIMNPQKHSAKDRPQWIKDVTMPIHKWYVSIICVDPKNSNLEKSCALTMEQVCINAASVKFGKTPYGNINESHKRQWKNAIL